MAGGSIEEPGVEVIQEFVTNSPTIVTPTLPTLVVGACYQVVDAFDDEGDPQVDALAGTYQDGLGVISYNLPGLATGASLTGLSDLIRVFLVYGAVSRELNSLADESVITTGTTGVFTLSTLRFTEAGATWLQEGVEAGDVVRFTYRGETLDLVIASVDNDTQLTLTAAGGIIDASLAGVSYSIVRDPAEFIFSAGTQANVEYGSDLNYLRFAVKSTSAYPGSLGDSLAVHIVDSQHFADGLDGAVGDGIFTSATGTFGSIVVNANKEPTTVHWLGIKAAAPVTGAAEVFREVQRVVDATTLLIETGEGVGLAAQNWWLGSQVDSGSNMVTSTSTSVTAAGKTFSTTIPGYVGAFPYAPTTTTYIEIDGDGVYEVSQVTSNTALTLATATAGTATDKAFVIAVQVQTAADGATGALTDFATATGGLLDIPASGGVPSSSTYISKGQGAGDNRAITSITSDTRAVVAAFGSSFSEAAWQAVNEDANLTLTWNPVDKVLQVQLARVNGVSSNTYAEIAAAVTSTLDPAYNATVAEIFTATVTGSGTILGTDVAYSNTPIILQLDGGADASDLLLDADLLGSTTPTASVYVSYRALRTDIDVVTEVTSVDDIETKLGVISVDNPLALGAYFAILASPSRPIYALGVDEISSTKPNGTPAAYTRALETAEGADVYSIAVLTQDPSVHSILQSHVDSMSQPTNKSERIGWFNTALPAFSRATVVASGTDGNTGATFTSSATAEFSASVDFAAAGVQAGDILVVTANASNTDSPDVVSGTADLYGIDILAVKPGNNFVLQLDGTQTGVSTDWNSLVDVSFTVYRAGTAITQPVDQAEAIAGVGEGYLDRRMFHVWPDEGTADVDGTEQLLDGHFIAAGWAGKVSETSPEQPFTRLTLPGWLSLSHSNGYFSRAHLNRMAGGGTFITVQDTQSAPVRCRHQLSTDTSTLQKRELSITKTIDYVAKFLRLGLQKHTGRFNITQTYLDALTTIVQGYLRNLVEAGRVLDAKLLELAVDDVQGDRINIKVAVSVFNPANYIVVTVQV